MSFNINGPDNKPVIREAQNLMNDGGAGNTGYMYSGRRKSDEEEDLPFGTESDEFIRREDYSAGQSKKFYDIIIDIIASVLYFFKNLFSKQNEKSPKNKDFLTLSSKKK